MITPGAIEVGLGAAQPPRERVCLVACTSRKGSLPAPAEFIYRSPLFSAGRSFAEQRADRWFVLSAKHGLLAPTEEVAPYNESLVAAGGAARAAWATNVHRRLAATLRPHSDILFLAGSTYRAHLEPMLRSEGHRTAAPMSSLGIGQQVAWLQKVEKSGARLRDLDRFYRLLGRLALAIGGSVPVLKEVSARSVKARKGIYFFFEPGEKRMTSPFEDRVVRIGTHAVSAGSKAALWGRLRTHRGAADESGNHRGSIFRLHVGECLRRAGQLERAYPDWGSGQSGSADVRTVELALEVEVSRRIGAMGVLWLEVADDASPDSDRAYLERNLIALLAGPDGPLDLPSSRWLGQWSTRDTLRTAGLWNVNYVQEPYESEALNVLELYIEIAEEGRSPDCRSRASPGWRARAASRRREEAQAKLL